MKTPGRGMPRKPIQLLLTLLAFTPLIHGADKTLDQQPDMQALAAAIEYAEVWVRTGKVNRMPERFLESTAGACLSDDSSVIVCSPTTNNTFLERIEFHLISTNTRPLERVVLHLSRAQCLVLKDIRPILSKDLEPFPPPIPPPALSDIARAEQRQRAARWLTDISAFGFKGDTGQKAYRVRLGMTPWSMQNKDRCIYTIVFQQWDAMPG